MGKAGAEVSSIYAGVLLDFRDIHILTPGAIQANWLLSGDVTQAYWKYWLSVAQIARTFAENGLPVFFQHESHTTRCLNESCMNKPVKKLGISLQHLLFLYSLSGVSNHTSSAIILPSFIFLFFIRFVIVVIVQDDI